MGSSNSRHVVQVSERRDQRDYPTVRRDSGSASSGGTDFADALGRITESQMRGPARRGRCHGRFRTGRFSSTRYHETSTPSLDPVAPVSISGQRPGAPKGNASSAKDSLPVEYSGASWAAAMSSGSSALSLAEPSAPVQEPARNVDTGRNIASGRSSVGFVMEILPVTVVDHEIVFADSAEVRPARALASSDSQNLWLEGHPPWISRWRSSEAHGLDSISNLAGLSQSTPQNLQAVCDTTVQHHRVNEMQERLQRIAKLPPSLDIHDLQRRGILAAESPRAQRQRTGNASSSMSGSDRTDFPFRSTSASLQAWEIAEEGRLVEYRHSLYSETWGRRLAESRQTGGRRFWNTLTRATSHRRASTARTTPAIESVVDSWAPNGGDHMDFQAFHSQSLNLEERRCCVRSQVLDEIHQQSITSTSTPIAARPAPDNVVHAIPIRKFTKQLWDEVTHCNICLVEYEEGDPVRVLPCHHEYNMILVQRVCPLCRGNVWELNSGLHLLVYLRGTILTIHILANCDFPQEDDPHSIWYFHFSLVCHHGLPKNCQSLYPVDPVPFCPFSGSIVP